MGLLKRYDAQDLRPGMIIRGLYNGKSFEGTIQNRTSLSHTRMMYSLEDRVIIADTKEEVDAFLGNRIQVFNVNANMWVDTTLDGFNNSERS